jgi:hypothetical protein
MLWGELFWGRKRREKRRRKVESSCLVFGELASAKYLHNSSLIGVI